MMGVDLEQTANIPKIVQLNGKFRMMTAETVKITRRCV
jgi:hypothetical protein